MRRIVSTLAALSLAAGALTVTAGTAHAKSPAQPPTSVTVSGNGSRVTLSRSSITAGWVSFRVSATNSRVPSDITMFRPKAHVTTLKVFNDLREELSPNRSTAAKGTRDLVRDATFYGLAHVEKGTPVTVTELLRAGTYYLVDIGTTPVRPPHLTILRVHDSTARRPLSPPRFTADISLTSANRFRAPTRLPARGTVLVRNVSDTIHVMLMTPVKNGTTDRQVQEFFDSGGRGRPPFARSGPSAGMGVQSPGRPARLTYRLPAGTYVLLCFVADKKTGMPHAFMGMHEVVTLR